MFKGRQQQQQQQQKKQQGDRKYREGSGSSCLVNIGRGKILSRQNNQQQGQQTQQQLSSSSTPRKTPATATTAAATKATNSLSPFKENMPRQQLKPTVRQQAPTASAAVPPQTNSPFSQSEIQELTNSFHLFDVHGTGSVKASELRSVLEMLQQEEGNSSNSSSSSRINTLIEKLSYIGDDENEDEMLTLEDYLDLMASTTVTGSTNEQETIPAIFDLFDSDGKGYISIDDLHRVSVELGEQMTQEELQEMIRRAKMKESDTDTHQQRGGRMQQHQQDDRVTLEEFQRILQTNFSIPLRDQRSDNA